MTSPSTSPALQLQGISVEFPTGFRRPPFRALHDLDLRVERGAIVGILGPNGSGKTTMLRVLAGLQRPTRGQATVLGRSPRDPSLVQRVGYQPEGPMPFPSLSGREFIGYMGDLLRLPRPQTKESAAALLDQLGLATAATRPIRSYSTGMRRRLALATALLADPDVLLLDEPTAGLDPEGSLLVMQMLQARAALGTTVLMASHHLQEVEQICDSVALFGAGRVLAEGSLDALLGTDATDLVVRGLDRAALQRLEAAVQSEGGEVVRRGTVREHLFALFRRHQAEDRR